MVKQAIVSSDMVRARIRSNIHFCTRSNGFLRLLLCKDQLRVDFDFCGKHVGTCNGENRKENGKPVCVNVDVGFACFAGRSRCAGSSGAVSDTPRSTCRSKEWTATIAPSCSRDRSISFTTAERDCRE